MEKKSTIKKWFKTDKSVNIALITLIGFLLGDFINNIVEKFIDNFLVHSIIGISSIYIIWYFYSKFYFKNL